MYMVLYLNSEHLYTIKQNTKNKTDLSAKNCKEQQLKKVRTLQVSI